MITLAILEKNEGNRTHTAKELGMSIRTIRVWISEMKAMGWEVTDPANDQGNKKKDFGVPDEDCPEDVLRNRRLYGY